jgi:hypothetical protein
VAQLVESDRLSRAASGIRVLSADDDVREIGAGQPETLLVSLEIRERNVERTARSRPGQEFDWPGRCGRTARTASPTAGIVSRRENVAAAPTTSRRRMIPPSVDRRKLNRPGRHVKGQADASMNAEVEPGCRLGPRLRYSG